MAKDNQVVKWYSSSGETISELPATV